MKKYILIIPILLIVTIISFFLFEPIATYTSGWSALPTISKLKPIAHYKDTTSKKADSILKKLFVDQKAPGISIAVGVNGNVAWSNAIGYSDIKNAKEIELITQFRIGSTSKAVTSMGLGVLLQNGKLNLDTKVKDFVPYISDTFSDLTLKQLASHTSGIRNYETCFCFPIWEQLNNDEYATVQESIGKFDNSELLFSSGTDFSYSSYNYTILSAMIEGASNKNFLSFMQTAVFDPLQMNYIQGETAAILPKNISKFYEVENGAYKEAFKVNNSNKWAGGGFVSNPTDLVKLGNALLTNKLLDNKTTEALTQPILLNNGAINKQRYAVGWRNGFTEKMFDKTSKTQIIHHAGTAQGSTSVLILFPEYKITISILMNKSSTPSDLFEYSFKLAELFIAKNQKAVALPNNQKDQGNKP